MEVVTKKGSCAPFEDSPSKAGKKLKSLLQKLTFASESNQQISVEHLGAQGSARPLEKPNELETKEVTASGNGV